MNNEELLQELAAKVQSGKLSRGDVLRRLNVSPAGADAPLSNKFGHLSVTKMLYVLGAAIVIIGVVIFVAQIWSDIGSIGRIAVTLGLGLVMTASGSVLLNQRPSESIGSVFHFIGGALIPGGAVVTLAELSTGVVAPWPVAITFGAIFAFYALLNTVHKHVILTFFTIANGTAFVYLLVEALVGFQGDLSKYLTMIIGLSYLLLSRAFGGTWNGRLVGLLNFAGIAGFLNAAFAMVFDSIVWQMLYFLILIGCLYLATSIRSRSILVVSTAFLLAHVSYITREYFANSLGWPISLVLLGFVFIGLGYASITINKKYIAA